MPDVTRMTMAQENSAAKRRPADEDRGLPHRGWKCPSDERIASYLDAAVDSHSRSRLESHLADCEYCRTLVAELAKVQRDPEMPSLPPGLIQRAVALVPPKSARMHWLWGPAAAMAGMAFLVIAAVVLRSPERLIIRSPSAPGPAIAKSEPAPTRSAPAHEVVRKPSSADLLPSVLSPRQGSIVERERLEFQWKTVPHSRYYEIHVVTSEGDLAWEGGSEESVLQPPADVTLTDGSYFVWITAYLENGREAKSVPVRFSLASSR